MYSNRAGVVGVADHPERVGARLVLDVTHVGHEATPLRRNACVRPLMALAKAEDQQCFGPHDTGRREPR